MVSEAEVTYEEVVNMLDRNQTKLLIALITVISALGGFLFGYDTGIIGSVLIYVPFKLTASSTAALVSYLSFFAAIGAVAAGPITDKFGRKSMLIADGAMYAAFAVLAALSTSLTQLIIWRALIGFAIGADTAIATSYISEFSPSKLRGRYAFTQQVMTFIGIVASFWVGYILAPSANWRLMLGLGAVPAAILLVLRNLLPESPRWLIITGKTDKAKEALRRLGVDVKGKIIPPATLSATYRELFENRAARNALIVVGLWLMFQQITGINIILYYGPYIYKYIGLSGPRAILNTALSESLGAIAYAISWILIDRAGRRKLGIAGYSIMVISYILMLAGIMYFNAQAFVTAAILIFSASTIFLFAFKIGPAMGFVLQGESLSAYYRATGAGILAAIDWVANGIIILVFPLWKSYFGVLSFFALELVLTLLAFTFVVLMVPETKGKTIEEMQLVYGRPIRELRKEIRQKDQK